MKNLLNSTIALLLIYDSALCMNQRFVFTAKPEARLEFHSSDQSSSSSQRAQQVARANETTQPQDPMSSLMQTMQGLYSSDAGRAGASTPNPQNQAPEKTFLGIRAPVSDKDKNRYVSWQKKGELTLMENELHELNYQIEQRSRVSFERFKLERRRSFLHKVMDNQSTKNLNIVRCGTLEQAEGMVWSLENPPAAQLEPSYHEIKKEERMLARKILEARPDYRAKHSQNSSKAQAPASIPQSNSSSSSSAAAQQQSRSQEVKAQSTVSSHAESLKAFNTAGSASFKSHAAYDLKLTTPTDSDLLFRQRVTADPAINLGEYLVQVRELVTYMKENGLYTAQQSVLFIKEIAQGTAQHLAHVAQHPVEYAQGFVEANLELAKETALFFIDVYSAPEELYVNESELRLYQEAVMRRGENIAQKYNFLCEVIPQMNRTEWANLTSSIITDGLILHGTSKSFNFASKKNFSHALRENPVFSKIHETLERTLAKQPEVITAEGITLRIPAEPVSSSSSSALERSSNNKTSAGSSNHPPKVILRVDNMGQFFETPFGKEIKDSVQKMRGDKPVYVVTEKIKACGLRKGDQIYLDNLHKDHLEVFDKWGTFIKVLNLDGTDNISKTRNGVGRSL